MRNLLTTILSLFVFAVVQAQGEYHFIESSSDSIFYEVAGKGKTVLFLAGGPGGPPESLKPIVEYVCKDYHTILMHQRGTGMSSTNKIDFSSITIDQYINDINDIFEKENITDAYIIGHSWGAMLALDYMVKNPAKVKGGVLIGASGYSLDFTQSMNEEIFKRMTPVEMDSIRRYAEQTYSENPYLKEEAQNKMMALILSKQFYNSSLVDGLLSLGPVNGKVNEMMMNDLAKKDWNLQKELENLEIPVTIVNGTYDPIGKEYVTSLKQSLKNSEVHFLDECGHYVWLEKPTELQEIIEEFLSR